MIGLIFQLIGAYFVGYCCCIFLEAPANLRFRIPVIDVVGWLVYLIAVDYLQWTLPVSTYISSLVIAIMSHVFARRYREPVTVFFLPGFFTLVPGGGMYRTALAFIQAETTTGVRELGTTMFIALSIALAVFTVDSFVNVIYNNKRPKFVRKNRRLIFRKPSEK